MISLLLVISLREAVPPFQGISFLFTENKGMNSSPRSRAIQEDSELIYSPSIKEKASF